MAGRQYLNTSVQDSASAQFGDTHIYLGSDSQEERKCQQLLKTSDYELHKEKISNKYPQTCRWILDDPLFQHWHQGEGCPVLWFSADPGCGKTVFAKSLVDEVLSDDGKATGCYFFFERGVQEQESMANALSAILHQLFKSQPWLLKHAVAEWKQVGNRLPTETYALWRVLRRASGDPKAQPIICILDALDECQDHDRKRLVECVSKLKVDAQERERSSNIKFLVTSRPDPDMQMFFKPYIDVASVAWLRGEHGNDKLRQEVDLVVTEDIDRWKAEFSLSESHRKLLHFRLTQLEQRTYLWWAHVRHDIHKMYCDEGDANDIMIENVIRTLPPSLENVYENILQKLPKAAVSKARDIFSVMLAARRPLNLGEALRLSTILGHLNRGGFPKLGNDEQKLKGQLRRWCGPFVFVYHSKFYFIHPTARDFLLRCYSDGKQVDAANWLRSLALHDAHETLAIASYTELQCHRNTTTKRSAVVTPNDESTPIDDTFLEYAASYGSHHAAEALRSMNQDSGKGVLTRFRGFGMNLEIVDTEGRSLLHHLVLYEYSKNVCSMIEAVLQAGGLVQTADHDNMHALQHAVRRGNADIVSLLLKCGFCVNKPIQRKSIPFHHTDPWVTCSVARRNKLDTVSLTAAHAAILYGRSEELKLLIEAGANLRAQDLHKRTLLHAALELSLPGTQLCDAWEIHEQMVDHIWDYEDEKAWDDTLLEADKVRMEILSLLFEMDPALVYCQDERRRTGLHLVRYDERCYSARSVIVLLLQIGADPTIKDEDGITPIHLAAKNGNVECLELLVTAAGANAFAVMDKEGRNCLHYAAMAPDRQVVKYILADANGITLIDTVDVYGQSPLHISLFDMAQPLHGGRACLDTVKTLLRAGVLVGLKSRQGRDALAHYLVAEPFQLDHEIVHMLLRYGANAFF